jgi:hypothetical protein
LGAVVIPGIGRVEMSGVLVKAGVGVGPADAVDGSMTAAVPSTVRAPRVTSSARIEFLFVGGGFGQNTLTCMPG